MDNFRNASFKNNRKSTQVRKRATNCFGFVKPGNSAGVERRKSLDKPTNLTVIMSNDNEDNSENLQNWSEWLGRRVSIGGVKFGILRYFGETEFAGGTWCGVELDEPVGKNDGSVKGIRYFECENKYGIFAPLSKTLKILDNEEQSCLSPKERTSRLPSPKLRPTEQNEVTRSISRSATFKIPCNNANDPEQNVVNEMFSKLRRQSVRIENTDNANVELNRTFDHVPDHPTVERVLSLPNSNSTFIAQSPEEAELLNRTVTINNNSNISESCQIDFNGTFSFTENTVFYPESKSTVPNRRHTTFLLESTPIIPNKRHSMYISDNFNIEPIEDDVQTSAVESFIRDELSSVDLDESLGILSLSEMTDFNSSLECSIGSGATKLCNIPKNESCEDVKDMPEFETADQQKVLIDDMLSNLQLSHGDNVTEGWDSQVEQKAVLLNSKLGGINSHMEDPSINNGNNINALDEPCVQGDPNLTAELNYNKFSSLISSEQALNTSFGVFVSDNEHEHCDIISADVCVPKCESPILLSGTADILAGKETLNSPKCLSSIPKHLIVSKKSKRESECSFLLDENFPNVSLNLSELDRSTMNNTQRASIAELQKPLIRFSSSPVKPSTMLKDNVRSNLRDSCSLSTINEILPCTEATSVSGCENTSMCSLISNDIALNTTISNANCPEITSVPEIENATHGNLIRFSDVCLSSPEVIFNSPETDVLTTNIIDDTISTNIIKLVDVSFPCVNTEMKDAAVLNSGLVEQSQLDDINTQVLSLNDSLKTEAVAMQNTPDHHPVEKLPSDLIAFSPIVHDEKKLQYSKFNTSNKDRNILDLSLLPESGELNATQTLEIDNMGNVNSNVFPTADLVPGPHVDQKNNSNSESPIFITKSDKSDNTLPSCSFTGKCSELITFSPIVVNSKKRPGQSENDNQDCKIIDLSMTLDSNMLNTTQTLDNDANSTAVPTEAIVPELCDELEISANSQSNVFATKNVNSNNASPKHIFMEKAYSDLISFSPIVVDYKQMPDRSESSTSNIDVKIPDLSMVSESVILNETQTLKIDSIDNSALLASETFVHEPQDHQEIGSNCQSSICVSIDGEKDTSCPNHSFVEKSPEVIKCNAIAVDCERRSGQSKCHDDKILNMSSTFGSGALNTTQTFNIDKQCNSNCTPLTTAMIVSEPEDHHVKSLTVQSPIAKSCENGDVLQRTLPIASTSLKSEDKIHVSNLDESTGSLKIGSSSFNEEFLAKSIGSSPTLGSVSRIDNISSILGDDSYNNNESVASVSDNLNKTFDLPPCDKSSNRKNDKKSVFSRLSTAKVNKAATYKSPVGKVQSPNTSRNHSAKNQENVNVEKVTPTRKKPGKWDAITSKISAGLNENKSPKSTASSKINSNLTVCHSTPKTSPGFPNKFRKGLSNEKASPKSEREKKQRNSLDGSLPESNGNVEMQLENPESRILSQLQNVNSRPKKHDLKAIKPEVPKAASIAQPKQGKPAKTRDVPAKAIKPEVPKAASIAQPKQGKPKDVPAKDLKSSRWSAGSQVKAQSRTEPRKFISKTELVREIQELGANCENRTKELNLLKIRLRHATLGFEAFAILNKYINEEYDPFSQPFLQKEYSKAKEELSKAGEQLQIYRQQLDQLQTVHADELIELTEKLGVVHADEICELKSRHSEELAEVDSHHKQQIQKLKNSFKKEAEENDEQNCEMFRELQDDYNKHKRDLEDNHSKKIREMTTRHEEVQYELQKRLEDLNAQYASLQKQLRDAEFAFMKDKNAKIQYISAKKNELEKEVDSLKAVLEIKTTQIQDLHKENFKIKKELEELPAAKETIRKLELKNEDLKAVMHQKVKMHRKLSTENQQLAITCEKEAKVNSRLSQANEELQWRLQQSMESSIRSTSLCASPELWNLEYGNIEEERSSSRMSLPILQSERTRSRSESPSRALTPSRFDEKPSNNRTHSMSSSWHPALPTHAESPMYPETSTPLLQRERSWSVRGPRLMPPSQSKLSTIKLEKAIENEILKRNSTRAPKPIPLRPSATHQPMSMSWGGESFADYYEELDDSCLQICADQRSGFSRKFFIKYDNGDNNKRAKRSKTIASTVLEQDDEVTSDKSMSGINSLQGSFYSSSDSCSSYLPTQPCSEESTTSSSSSSNDIVKTHDSNAYDILSTSIKPPRDLAGESMVQEVESLSKVLLSDSSSQAKIEFTDGSSEDARDTGGNGASIATPSIDTSSQGMADSTNLDISWGDEEMPSEND